MATFDAWEAAISPPEDYLMHFRTPGSKNGVRRYQNKDGTWTRLGLEERKKREGWGDSQYERKLQKRLAKAENRQARAEYRKERKAAREQKRFERAEARRKRSLSGLTDAEMKAKLERARMEAEYKQLTQKDHRILETGAKVVTRILDYKDNKQQRVIDLNKQKLDMARTKADIIRAKEGTKQAEFNYKKMQEDRKAGLADERKANLIGKKIDYKNTTIRGGLSKLINMKLTAGKSKQYEQERKAKGEVEANRIKAEGARKANEDKEAYTARREKEAARKAEREARAAQRQAEREAERQREATQRAQARERAAYLEELNREQTRIRAENERRENLERSRSQSSSSNSRSSSPTIQKPQVLSGESEHHRIKREREEADRREREEWERKMKLRK